MPIRLPADPLVDAVAAVLAEAGVGAGDVLCCAFSGGVDSAVLLHLLAILRSRLGFRLEAAHVHHGLSPNADAWLAFCERRCAQLAVPFHAFRVSVARNDPAGLEAAARRARRAALGELACDWLVFGHHQDDQAETLLFRLLRGTGLRGAGAMAAVEPGRPGRLRPLLGIRRAAIVARARADGLAWVEDESNAELAFTRNALRHRLLPQAEALFPAAVPALGRAAEHFHEAGGLLDDLAAMDEAACGGAVLERAALLALDDARVRNLLRWQARRLGAEAPTRARLAEALRQLREADPARPLHLALGALACSSYRGRIWLEPAMPGAAATPRAWRGEPELAWAGGRVRFTSTRGEGLGLARLERAAAIGLAGRWAGLSLRLSPRRPRRSFKNLCQEAGIPAWLRERLPVLVVDGEAAWIAEVGVAAELACAPGEPGVMPVWEPGGA